uniref:Uncharacterized protein n=2 Tax=Emiliania huxleyi TaxID=2903 RepID=A0A0D3JPG5_EMIH1
MAAILGILSSAATTPAVRSTTTLTLLLTALAGPRTAALSLSLPGGRWFRERGAVTQTRVAVLGGGFAGLTAARTLVASHPGVEVLLCDQREFFEYTPGILRAWVEPSVHPRLVNPIRRLLRGRRASFRRVPPGCAVAVEESTVEAALPATSDEPTRPLRFTIGRGAISPPAGLRGAESPLVDYPCDYVVLAPGGDLSPITDDREADGTIVGRRARLKRQVEAALSSGVELAAELAEKLGPGAVTLAVGPTLPRRGSYPGDPAAGSLPCDPGAGLLPGFRD